MSLGDYAGDGYLREGWHNVCVTECRTWEAATTDTTGVEFTLVERESGNKSRVSFSVTSEKALKRFCSFAQACGFTNEELARYNEKDPASHRVFVNRKVQVLVEKGEKYHDVVDWSPIDSETPVVVPKQTPPASELPEPSEAHDGIPF